MKSAAIPVEESKRIEELYKYEFNNKAYEEEFEDIVRLASGLCNVPMSLITLVDIDRQWFKAKIGIEEEETSRNVAFCAHAILQNDIFEVKDATEDERFQDNPFVTDSPNIRYYAGMPLITKNGYKLGTLCVLDSVPRELNEDQYMALKVLSKQVIKLFELRVRNKELDRAKDIHEKMMSIMAHDIRGPLASMEMILDYKIKNYLSETKVKEVEQLVSEQLKGTVSMLNNIVDWGKLQLNFEADTKEIFNLHELCKDCFQYYTIHAQSKQNELINAVAADFSINANRQGMEFVLRNLIGNAVKFTTAGKIVISAELREHVYCIKVQDNGVGISAEEIKALNHKKWSVQNVGTENEKGSGVGLKLIEEYLTNANAGLSFESKNGTTVSILLPFV